MCIYNYDNYIDDDENNIDMVIYIDDEDANGITKDFAKQRYNTPYACNVI